MLKINYRTMRSWKLCFFMTAFICLSFILVHGAENSDKVSNTSKAAGTNAPQSQQKITGKSHPITQAALKLGVLSCLRRVDEVSKFLTAGSRSGILILPAATDPDQHLLSTSLEIIRPNNTRFYASASFSPNLDAVYDTVEYVEMSWEKVEKTIFKNLKREGVLKENIVVLGGGPVKVFLMPAGNGCIVIKKEIVQ